ncbi:MBL fold metallo-hydrolase [Chloroflexi bacterium TSY]|nr:MBL fold metallo-hydrolase [Chloroflexi bacterium TSY]
MPELDSRNPEAVRAYVEGLPSLLHGTAKGNTSCVEVQTGGETFIIDAGTGIRELGLELMKGPCGQGQGKLHIFFSHTHWDHIHGFPFFLPAFVPGNQITFYSVHDLELALTEQQRYRFFPVSIDSAQAERELTQMDASLYQRYGFIPAMQAQREYVKLESGKPFSVGQIRINTIRNHHPGDAYSYRFEDQHSTFVYSSDAEYKNLDASTFRERVEFFQNADAVIFDAQYGLRDTWESKVDYGHSSAMIGVDFARRAGVKKLLLSHHEPTSSDQQLQEIQETATAYQAQDRTLPTCEIIVAYEGLEIDLAPPGAVDVRLMPNEEAAILTPGSVFDEHGVTQLVEQLTEVVRSETPIGSIVDLSQVERLTTASLKTLVTFSQQREAGALVLATPSAMVKEVIKLGGYGDYFAIYPTVDEANKAVQAREALNLPGQTINNRYSIVEAVGQSAVGTVLEVVDQMFQRKAALRVLSPAFSIETRNRFVFTFW